jgi:hypothetical protein
MSKNDVTGTVDARRHPTVQAGGGSGSMMPSGIIPAPAGQRPSSGVTTSQDHGFRGPNFVVLWVIVSVLWSVATGLRILRVWVPLAGWPAVISSAFTWAGLLVPPLVFAIILIAMNRIAAGRHSPGH